MRHIKACLLFSLVCLPLLHIFSLSTSSIGAKPHIAVIGAGWSGFGAAKALCDGGCKVTLLDTIPDPTGTMQTSTGKPIEPGQKGFWYDYPNIAQLVKDIDLQESDIFTEYLNSSFYSPSGLEATAPVFSSASLPQLPSPLGQVFASFSHFKRLPIQDRASIAGLLYAMIDLYRDEETFQAYDRMSAYDLFANLGVSKRLLDDFLRPTLLVGLFKPPEELSAAVTMELLYYYALAHQSSFDVRWLKQGMINNVFFKRLTEKLINEQQYDLEILGGSRVTKLTLNEQGNQITSIDYQQSSSPSQSLDKLDGVVLALGVKGLKNILINSPELAYRVPQLSRAASLKSIDCISIRLWLDKKVTTLSPANVFAQFPALRGAGGTFFLLDDLHSSPSAFAELWGMKKEKKAEDEGEWTAYDVSNLGSVVGIDFYNAGALLLLKDEDLIYQTIMQDLLPQVESQFKDVKIVEYDVKRYPEAVSWFSPGSYACRPRTTVEGIDNLYCAGDWVVMQDPLQKMDSNRYSKVKEEWNNGEHGAKGLCQERAYVSGLFAANHLLLKFTDRLPLMRKLAKVLPIRTDEPQVVLGRFVNNRIAGFAKRVFGLSAPWIR